MNTERISTVIFDMDGVIVNSEECWEDLEQEYLSEICPTWERSDFPKLTGLSNVDIHRFVVTNYNASVDYASFKLAYDRMAQAVYGSRASLIPGVTGVISQLHAASMKLAIASSSPADWIQIVLERFELQSFFSVITSGEELKAGQGKPLPLIYELTAERFGVAASQCAVIEDSRNGALSAKGADMLCIGLRNGHNSNQDLSAADIVLQSGFSGLDSLLSIN